MTAPHPWLLADERRLAALMDLNVRAACMQVALSTAVVLARTEERRVRFAESHRRMEAMLRLARDETPNCTEHPGRP